MAGYLTVVDKAAHERHFKRVSLHVHMLCASVTAAGKQANTCPGDSGGPLFIPAYRKDTNKYVVDDASIEQGNQSLDTIIGITSFGTDCTKFSEGVYTSVPILRLGFRQPFLMVLHSL